MIKKLKKIIEKKGYVMVANDLGYRSITTIKTWFKKNEIPVTAIEKVRAYLKEKKV